MEQLQPATITPPSTDRCAEALIEVVPAIMRTIRLLMRAERASDLSVPQFRALGYIRRHAGTSLSAVAGHVGLSVPAASRLIDALVARGLVARHASAADRRAVGLELSGAGTELLERARAHAVRELAARLEALDGTQRTDLTQVLEDLRAIFATPGAETGMAATHQTERTS